ILERDLHFEKLVIPQIVETFFFNLAAVVFAVMGFGVTTFTYAVLLRGISGCITIYIISPWKIRLGFSKKVAKHLLSFGIPFQTNSILALLKDDLLIAYVGKILPLAQVGYIGFAQKWAFTPLRLIMDNVIRITFPSFARLQHEKEHLAKGIEKSLFVLGLTIFPSLVGLVILAPSFLLVVPRYQKWEPAVLSLAFFAINAALSSISTPLTNALNAIGKIKVSLYLMIFWTITTWIITPLFIFWFGFNGFAAASAVIAGSVVIVVPLTRKFVQFSIVDLRVPVIATVVMGIFLFFFIKLFPTSIFSILLSIVAGGMLYLGVAYFLARDEVVKDIVLIKKQFIK
ncbi:MAG: oligosaccharide flippase family protein, partial [Candidatus Levyibacteriota bacterium]